MNTQYSSEELVRLEHITLKNMVRFYHQELRRLMNGEKAVRVFTKATRQSLRNIGVLQIAFRGNNGRHLVITPKALQILQTIQ